MSRIRSLHPSQWTEEDFVACSAMARLLLLGLRNEADDHGVFEWRPVSLKLRLLPADNVDIEALLSELVDQHQIARFVANGASYGFCLQWGQTTRHPSYRFPEPPAGLQSLTDNGVSTHAEDGSLTDNGVSTHAGEESESESESEREGTGAPAGAALSLNFDLPDEWRAEAAEGRRGSRLPEVNLDAEWAKFRVDKAGELMTEANRRKRWFRWALNARAVPNGAAGNGAAPAEPPPPADPEQSQRRWWGRDQGWWRQFDPSHQTRARKWVDSGKWAGRGGLPGTPDCLIDARLAQAAVAERARRLAQQPTMPLPIAGGRSNGRARDAPQAGTQPDDAKRGAA